MRRPFFKAAMVKVALLGALALPFATTSEALAGRSAADTLRVQVIRVHTRLSRAALDSLEVLEAQSAVARAFATMYQARENVLVEVRKGDEYADLKLALWHQQQLLAGHHQEIPAKIANILATASDSMTIRSRIGKLESDALQASDEYVAAREELNAMIAAERQAIADALDQVRNDPEFIALSQQLRDLQRSLRSAGNGRSGRAR